MGDEDVVTLLHRPIGQISRIETQRQTGGGDDDSQRQGVPLEQQVRGIAAVRDGGSVANRVDIPPEEIVCKDRVVTDVVEWYRAIRCNNHTQTTTARICVNRGFRRASLALAIYI